jgi:hypothetical protein
LSAATLLLYFVLPSAISLLDSVHNVFITLVPNESLRFLSYQFNLPYTFSQMAPAASKKAFDNALVATTQTASTRKPHTETHTKYITVTSNSFPPHDPAKNSAPKPSLVHGIVPGRSHSPSLSTALSTMTTPTLPGHSTLTTFPRRSTYSRPSPPGVLYPEAIVPHSAYTYTHQHHPHTVQHPEGMDNNNSNVLWYLPFDLEVPIFAVIMLWLAWAGLAWCITSPPRTWWKTEEQKERRPLDKPSKYVKYTRGEQGEGETIHLHEYTHINISPREDNEGEVRRRTRHRRHTSPALHESSACTPKTTIRRDAPSPALSSPQNPFLHPPNHHTSRQSLNPRNSAEYMAQHARFFAGNTSSLSLYSPIPSVHSRTPSSSASETGDYAAMNTADIEALEAGTGAELTPRWASETGGHERKTSWVDLSIGKMEDVVSGWVESLAKWTDGSDDEELVLLVVDRRREDERAVPRRRQVKVE